jgi:hypothetical protein
MADPGAYAPGFMLSPAPQAKPQALCSRALRALRLRRGRWGRWRYRRRFFPARRALYVSRGFPFGQHGCVVAIEVPNDCVHPARGHYAAVHRFVDRDAGGFASGDAA